MSYLLVQYLYLGRGMDYSFGERWDGDNPHLENLEVDRGFGWTKYRIRNIPFKNSRTGAIEYLRVNLPVYEDRSRPSRIARMIGELSPHNPDSNLEVLSRITRWYGKHMAERVINAEEVRANDLLIQSLAKLDPHGTYKVNSIFGKHVSSPSMDLPDYIRQQLISGTYNPAKHRPYQTTYGGMMAGPDGSLRFVDNTALAYPLHMDNDGDIVIGNTIIRMNKTGASKPITNIGQFPSTHKMGRFITPSRWTPETDLGLMTATTASRISEQLGDSGWEKIRRIAARDPALFEEVVRKQVNTDIIGVATNKFEIRDLFEAMRALQNQPEEIRNAILNSPESKVAFIAAYKKSKITGARTQLEDIIKAVAKGTEQLDLNDFEVLQHTIALDLGEDLLLKYKNLQHYTGEEQRQVFGAFFGAKSLGEVQRILRGQALNQSIGPDSFITGTRFKIFNRTNPLRGVQTKPGQISIFEHLTKPVFVDPQFPNRKFGLLDVEHIQLGEEFVPEGLPLRRALVNWRDPLGEITPFLGGKEGLGVETGAVLRLDVTPTGPRNPLADIAEELERNRASLGLDWVDRLGNHRMPGLATGSRSWEYLTSKKGWDEVVRLSRSLSMKPKDFLRIIRSDPSMLPSLLWKVDLIDRPDLLVRVKTLLKKYIPQKAEMFSYRRAPTGEAYLDAHNQRILGSQVTIDIGMETTHADTAIAGIMDIAGKYNLTAEAKSTSNGYFRFFRGSFAHPTGTPFGMNPSSIADPKRYGIWTSQAKNAAQLKGMNVLYLDFDLEKLAAHHGLTVEQLAPLFGTGTNMAADPGVGFGMLFKPGYEAAIQARLEATRPSRHSPVSAPQTPIRVETNTLAEGVGERWISDPSDLTFTERVTKLLDPAGTKIELHHHDISPILEMGGSQYPAHMSMTLAEVVDKGMLPEVLRELSEQAGPEHVGRFERFMANPGVHTLNEVLTNLPRARTDLGFGQIEGFALLGTNKFSMSTIPLEEKLGEIGGASRGFNGPSGLEAYDMVRNELISRGFDPNKPLFESALIDAKRARPIQQGFGALDQLSRITGMNPEALQQMPTVVRMSSLAQVEAAAAEREGANAIHVASAVFGNLSGLLKRRI